MRLLLVEDDPTNQAVMLDILASAGLRADVADNGQIAVHQVQARFTEHLPYDLVLMDMQMPVMDGVSAARLIRVTHPAEQLPIVAMTANAMKVDRDRCMEAGMNGFVTKPINPDELWRTLLANVKPREGLGRLQPKAVPAEDAQAAATRDSDPLLQALRASRVVDVDLGLLRTTNNPTFYIAMLRKFAAGQQDATLRATQALAGGDAAAAERIAHTLKGNRPAQCRTCC